GLAFINYTNIGEYFDKTYVIKNTGTSASSLGNFTLGNTAEFSFQGALPTTVAAGDSATFVVRFTPIAANMRTSTISFTNDDSDESPYNFTLQ
ncbi:choice-of-anchor D domain-containing protein, partial [bacterium]|nr:choice-of-anchor D domain-containing protein [bacterium]